MDNSILPIFPLPIFLLPSGKVRLRVFESKYIKLISIASAKGSFIIQQRPVSDDTENGNIGSLVEVHDFNQGEDGILEVDVYCLSIITVNEIMTDEGLTFGTITPMTHWSEENRPFSKQKSELATSLNDIINGDEMLSCLYEDKSLANESWVIARWLELLPITLTMKKSFICSHGYIEAKELVESIINQ
jgi:Lon protease-like protein